MKVKIKFKCLKDVTDINLSRQLQKNPYYSGDYCYFTEDKLYNVYGVSFWEEQPMIYVFEDLDLSYPHSYPLGVFDVLFYRIPPDWSISCPEKNNSNVEFLPSFWAKNPVFYELLIDGYAKEVEVMTTYRKKIEGTGMSQKEWNEYIKDYTPSIFGKDKQYPSCYTPN